MDFLLVRLILYPKTEHRSSIVMRKWLSYISVLVNLAVLAQDSTYMLRPVSIDGQKLSLQNKVIQQCNPNKPISEIVTQQLGGFIRSYGVGGLQNLSIRGMSGIHAPLYIGNYNMQSAMNGTFDISLLHPYHFSLASISESNLRNGGGQTLGQGLQLSNDFQSGFSSSQGFDSRLNSNTGFRWGWKNDKWLIAISQVNALYQNRENLKRYGYPLDTFNAPSRSFSLMGHIQYRDSNLGIFDLHYFGLNSLRNLPASLFGVNTASQTDQNHLGSLRWSKKWNIKHKTSVQQDIRSEQIGYSPTELHLFKMSKALVFHTVFTHDYFPLPNLIISGTVRTEDIFFNQDNPATTDRIRRNTFSSHLVYHLKSWQLILDNGIQTQQNVNQWIAKYGLYKRFKNTQFKLYWNKTIRMPTLNEWYWNQPGHAEGNLDLLPETGHRFNLNTQASYKNFSYDVDLYTGFYKNFVVWMANPILHPVNVKYVQVSGLDVRFEYKMLLSKTVKMHHTVRGNFTQSVEVNQWTNPREIKKTNTNPLIFTPFTTLGYIAAATWNKMSGYGSYSYTGSRYSQPDYNTSLPAFHLIDLGCSYAFSSINIGFEISNILDYAYHALPYVITPGRAFSINAIYKLNHIK